MELSVVYVTPVAPAHTEGSPVIVGTGLGFTVIVYADGVPVQLFTVGVTVMVAMMGEVPVLVAVNEGIFPVPLKASPNAEFELVHV